LLNTNQVLSIDEITDFEASNADVDGPLDEA